MKFSLGTVSDVLIRDGSFGSVHMMWSAHYFFDVALSQQFSIRGQTERRDSVGAFNQDVASEKQR
ncbi:hypothetical protein [Pseudomonas viridiflava]|uniref:hypothetical protein n=1 Tax=Pseudomonas viridiflava TaxID=33069 RepID=UPI000F03FEFF|nr:hypothetical protein [Pseudomonas viridiflava]MBD8200711.1 hypothetical protein [Pseudomonas viridiflava]